MAFSLGRAIEGKLLGSAEVTGLCYKSFFRCRVGPEGTMISHVYD